MVYLLVQSCVDSLNVVGLSPNDAEALSHAMRGGVSKPVIVSVEPNTVNTSIDPQIVSAPDEVEHDVPFEALLGQLGLSAHLEAFEDEGCAPQT